MTGQPKPAPGWRQGYSTGVRTAAVARTSLLGVGLGLWLALPQTGLGQNQAGNPPAAGPFTQSQQVWRVMFPGVVQQSYLNHPFYQITGDGSYSGARGGFADPLKLSTPESSQTQNLGLQFLHTLPPFGVESLWPLDWPFPKGIGAGFDFAPIRLTDEQALNTSNIPSGNRIAMDAYYYTMAFRIYAFDPSQPGPNFFFGVGLGLLEGRITSQTTGAATYSDFNQAPIGFTRLGVEAMGETFGARYELVNVTATRVVLKNNPYPGRASETLINMSGSQLRITGMVQF